MNKKLIYDAVFGFCAAFIICLFFALLNKPNVEGLLDSIFMFFAFFIYPFSQLIELIHVIPVLFVVLILVYFTITKAKEKYRKYLLAIIILGWVFYGLMCLVMVTGGG